MRTILFVTAAALPLLLAAPAPAQSPTQEPYPPAGAQPTQPGAPQKPSTQQQQQKMPEGGPAGTTRQKTGENPPMPQTAPGQKPGKAAQETMPRKQMPEGGKAATGKEAPGKAGAGQETTGSIGLNAEKRTQVRETIVRQHVEPVRNVNFNVRVGTAIPRTVELRVLPAEVITIVPQYRGYRFFTLADGRIIIVDPDTFEIVYIIG